MILKLSGGQIWDDEPRSTCWLWKFGAEPCDWDGFEGIETHPGAKMIRDRDQILDCEAGFEARISHK